MPSQGKFEHGSLLSGNSRSTRVSSQPKSTILEATEGKGAGFRFLADDSDTTIPDGRRVFDVLASIAKFKRGRIAERPREV